jgi:hypothetical protein
MSSIAPPAPAPAARPCFSLVAAGRTGALFSSGLFLCCGATLPLGLAPSPLGFGASADCDNGSGGSLSALPLAASCRAASALAGCRGVDGETTTAPAPMYFFAISSACGLGVFIGALSNKTGQFIGCYGTSVTLWHKRS